MEAYCAEISEKRLAEEFVDLKQENSQESHWDSAN